MKVRYRAHYNYETDKYIEKLISNCYDKIFRYNNNKHQLLWDYEIKKNIFGKERVILHLYSDCPGIVIGYRGTTINNFIDKIKEFNKDITVKLHECEKIYK